MFILTLYLELYKYHILNLCI